MRIETDDNEDGIFDEESIIKYYFNSGFSYEEIILLLDKRHGYPMSYSSLLRRLKAYGLSRRVFSNSAHSEETVELVRQRVRAILNGPGSSGGYRTVWHTLEMDGLRVPRVAE